VKKFKVFVILPAYNESDALDKLLPAIHAEMSAYSSYQMVLVDDSSTDETTQKAIGWAHNFSFIHLRHKTNAGCGAAINTGLLWAVPQAGVEDILLTLDADNTHLPIYFPALIKKVKEGYDIVTASYSMPGGQAFGLTIKRKFLSGCVNGMFRILFPIQKAKTYTNGFRAYKASTLKHLYNQYNQSLIEETGFPGSTELFLKARKVPHVRIAEVPFTLHYENRGSDSKIRIGRTIYAYLRLIKRFLLTDYLGE